MLYIQRAVDKLHHLHLSFCIYIKLQPKRGVDSVFTCTTPSISYCFFFPLFLLLFFSLSHFKMSPTMWWSSIRIQNIFTNTECSLSVIFVYDCTKINFLLLWLRPPPLSLFPFSLSFFFFSTLSLCILLTRTEKQADVHLLVHIYIRRLADRDTFIRTDIHTHAHTRRHAPTHTHKYVSELWNDLGFFVVFLEVFFFFP